MKSHKASLLDLGFRHLQKIPGYSGRFSHKGTWLPGHTDQGPSLLSSVSPTSNLSSWGPTDDKINPQFSWVTEYPAPCLPRLRRACLLCHCKTLYTQASKLYCYHESANPQGNAEGLYSAGLNAILGWGGGGEDCDSQIMMKTPPCLDATRPFLPTLNPLHLLVFP